MTLRNVVTLNANGLHLWQAGNRSHRIEGPFGLCPYGIYPFGFIRQIPFGGCSARSTTPLGPEPDSTRHMQ